MVEFLTSDRKSTTRHPMWKPLNTTEETSASRSLMKLRLSESGPSPQVERFCCPGGGGGAAPAGVGAAWAGGAPAGVGGRPGGCSSGSRSGAGVTKWSDSRNQEARSEAHLVSDGHLKLFISCITGKTHMCRPQATGFGHRPCEAGVSGVACPLIRLWRRQHARLSSAQIGAAAHRDVGAAAPHATQRRPTERLSQLCTHHVRDRPLQARCG